VNFRITRIEVPDWVSHDHDSNYADWLGEQTQFAFAVPWTFQIMAAPKTQHVFVRAPRADDAFWPLALGYWLSCLNLLIYGFGWSRPDRGLRWWYEQGFPTHDVKFALLKQIWLSDGQLDWLAAWLWTTSQMSYAGLFGSWPIEDHVGFETEWMEKTFKSANESSVPNPLVGGTDPLHLSGHIRGPLEEPPYGVPKLVKGGSVGASHRLVLHSMRGWYQALMTAGEGVAIRDRDAGVSVAVIVTTVGYLGQYKFCPDTGLWYSGSLKHHRVGN